MKHSPSGHFSERVRTSAAFTGSHEETRRSMANKLDPMHPGLKVPFVAVLRHVERRARKRDMLRGGQRMMTQEYMRKEIVKWHDRMWRDLRGAIKRAQRKEAGQ